MAARIKKGDKVLVLTGRDKGKTGLVLKVIPTEGSAIVDKVNVAKRHQKARQGGGPSGIIEKALPIPLSEIMPVDPKSGKATRVRFEVVGDRKLRKSVDGQSFEVK